MPLIPGMLKPTQHKFVVRKARYGAMPEAIRRRIGCHNPNLPASRKAHPQFVSCRSSDPPAAISTQNEEFHHVPQHRTGAVARHRLDERETSGPLADI